MKNPWMSRGGGHPSEDFEPVSLQLAGWGRRERAQLAYDLRAEQLRTGGHDGAAEGSEAENRDLSAERDGEQ